MESPSNTIKARLPLLAVFVAAALVVGCLPDMARYTPAQSPKKNRVDQVEMHHQMAIDPGREVLDPVMLEKLEGFLRRVNADARDRVTIAYGGETMGKIESNALAEAQLDALELYLARRGLRVSRTSLLAPDVEKGGAENEDGQNGDAASREMVPVAVKVARYVVTPPACPDWSKPPGPDFNNTTGSNFGCATARNFGLMVADPGDILRGGPMGPGDGEATVLAIQRYRLGETYDFEESESNITTVTFE